MHCQHALPTANCLLPGAAYHAAANVSSPPAGPDITGITVLTRSSRDMSVIQIACELRPLDLIHLSGHFGIPKVDPNAVMVPAPNGR